MTVKSFTDSLEIVKKGLGKFAFIYTRDELLVMKTAFNANLNIMKKQKFVTSFHYIGTINTNFMTQLTLDVFTRVIETGIFQFFEKSFQDSFPPYKNEIKEPKVFSIDDLKFGFIIWIFACGLSTLIFIIEILLVWIKKLRNFIIAFYALKILLNSRHGLY